MMRRGASGAGAVAKGVACFAVCCAGATTWGHACVEGAPHASSSLIGPPLYVNTQNFLPADGGSNSETFFGYRVDVADAKMVIGDPYFRDAGGRLVGGFSAFQYDPNLGLWTLEQHVAADPGYRGCSYQDISTDGSRVATITNTAASLSDWQVLVYVYGPTGWEFEQVIVPPTRASSVNIEGDTLLVGSWSTSVGVGYLYRRQPEGEWTLEATLAGSPPFETPLGVDCDVHGDLAILSGYGEYPHGYGAAVYRFDHATNTWQLEQTILATPEYPSLGWSVSTDSWRIVMGSRGVGGGASVFKYDPSLPGPPWHHEATFVVPVGGSRVIPDDVSVEGGLMFVSDRWGGENRRGRVHCYRYDAGSWSLEASLSRPGGEQDLDQFGGSFGRFHNTLVIGNFVYGDRAQASVFERLGEVPSPELPAPPACPVITCQPSGVPVVEGRELTLSVGVYAAGELTYRWQKDGVDVIDGVAPGGGQFIGASTPTMRVLPAGLADAGYYRVRVSNECATLTSVERFVRVLCRADFNRDGRVGSPDFFAFLSAFFTDSPGADFNGDGAVSSQDFFDFVGALFGGC